MRKILAILAALVLLPSLCTAELLDPCDDCMGYSTATSGALVTFTDASNWATYYADLTALGYTVVPTFKWNLYMLSGEDDGTTCTYTNIGSYLYLKDATGNDLALPYGGLGMTGYQTFSFRAPIDPGCYQVYLTMYVTVTSPEGITNTEACVDDACWILCVSPANCPSCSDIFCEIDCGNFPTIPAACPSWNAATDLSGLCYLGDRTGLAPGQVKWHLVSATDIVASTCVINPSEISTAGDLETYLAGTPDVWNTGYCFDSTLCDGSSCDLPYLASGSGRYEIYMTVWDADGTFVSYCDVGTLTEVDDPTASISSS